MKPAVMIAVALITLALLCFTIATAALARSRRAGAVVVWGLTLGVILDAAATLSMWVAAGRLLLNAHSLLGWTALFGMLAVGGAAWRHRWNKGPQARIGDRMDRYARLAYAYWVIAYVTGVAVGMTRAAHRHVSLVL